jgi:LPXTG-site transpeptidase (sortase) family protein
MYNLSVETNAKRWKSKSSVPRPPAGRRTRLGRVLSNILFALGALSLLAAMGYLAYTRLNTWLMGQDRFLVADQVLPISVPTMTLTPSPIPTSTPLPTHTATPTPTPSPTPTPTPAAPPAPVQIRIPALGVTRSIIKLPRIRDRQTGAWTWNTDRLFRRGRSDLVGHWEGSAYPGETGNMVLVGHNYGYGYSGVFVGLGRLKAGQKVIIVNKAGQTFTYRVESVNRIKWRRKDLAELSRHLTLLSPGGPERVTLVSCAGAEFEPFPERVYVVAVPVQ